KNEWIERMNSLGIDVGKKKCRAVLKDERGDIIKFFSYNKEGIYFAADPVLRAVAALRVLLLLIGFSSCSLNQNQISFVD
ncbi:MAG: hypothetical protein WAM14_07880, partial [Candidatus Nitrosopolaris sp.]